MSRILVRSIPRGWAEHVRRSAEWRERLPTLRADTIVRMIREGRERD